MRSSLFSSSNYGTVDRDGNDNSQHPKSQSTKAWKALIIGFGVLFIICCAIYYYGGISSGSSITSITSKNQNTIAIFSNEDLMSDISEKYSLAMSRRNSNSHQLSSDAANCGSLGEQLNAQTQEQTNEFVRYYSNELNDYLYTVYSDEVDNAGDSYEADGSAGYLWSGELPGITEPLYRYINEDCNGNDHFYSTQLANYGSSDWQQIAGFIMSVECSFNTALYEYYSETNCNHFYTIDKSEIENLSGDFEFQRIVGYVAKE